MQRSAAFVAALVLAACGGGGAAPTTTTTVPATSTLALTTITGPTPTTTQATTTTTTAPLEASLAVAGPEEVVYDWSADRCANTDIPDLPARAFRDDTGQVQLISTHIENRRFVGPSLDELDHPCGIIFEGAGDADPARFTDAEWIAAVYTEDGRTVYGLVHNEFHGWEHGACDGTDIFQCWYNSITLVVSTDSGSSYQRVPDPPGHVVATLPYEYAQGTGAQGLFSPSNIVKDAEGFYYALAKVGAHQTGAQTVCLMRTPDLADPDAWRFWTGSAFEGRFVDPYADEFGNARAYECPALDLDDIGAQMIESLTWNTFLERWVLVGISADHIDGREVWGFYYSFSDDLIDWTRRKLLLEIELPWTVDSPGSDVSYLYPSLLDPDSDSRNFETTDDTAYLYYTRNNAGHGSLDRDLIRVPVVFTLDD